ncbi:MAG: T9SS type A sorting domain-containing protein, partial [Bacteroidales bacterium]
PTADSRIAVPCPSDRNALRNPPRQHVPTVTQHSKREKNNQYIGVMMSLTDTITKLGHYAKKAAKAVTMPVNLLIAGVTLSTLLSFQEAQAQYDPQGDTIYGTGILSTQSLDSGLPIENVLLTLRPESMAMVTPDTTYTFITDNEGWAIFDNPGLPVYIDSTTGIRDLLNQETKVLPNFGSELNAFFPSIQKGTIEVYNMSGQLVQKQDFNTDHEYLQFNNMAAGMYVYNIRTEDGIELGGKFVKQNVPLKGPASRPASNVSSTFKNTQMYTATYWAKWEHPDYYTDSTLITLEDGNNGFINLFLTSNITPIPQHQDIVGWAKDGDNNLAMLAGVTAILYNQTLNQTTTLTTGTDGKYSFEDVPTGSVCFISVGGVSGMYSFNDIEYTVPNTISSMNDTIMDLASAVLQDYHPDIQQFNSLIQQTGHGTLSQTRYYWFDASVPTADIPTYNSQFAQLDAMGNNYIHAQTTDESQAHIKIYDGAYNTSTNSNVQFETPFGTYAPATIAYMTIHPGDLGSIGHELYQADGKNQCSDDGILGSNPPPTGPTAQDLAIAEFEMNYWVNFVYGSEETYFDLNKMDETLQSKSPQYSKSNSSTSFGDMEVNYSSK